ncbi:M23 family metallopeptidase [Aliifodinibius salicampi]|uniref:M23 family metallopeptidase n=1 Tax=Fodinibius salicampi TaxID=1920655 RepID=A0ABT3Q386_9BACT|nr:M23 family metallopeptidase [Fodinibius salicampi]MCW9714563.1 M23 family metallopeptidase [Fodinibius salicampi]
MIYQISLQYFIQLILPSIFLWELFRKSYPSKLVWIVKVLFSCLVLLFIFKMARWDLTSNYLRWLLVILFIPAVWVSYKNISDASDEDSSITFFISHGILIIGLVGLNFSVFKGYNYPNPAINLSFPLAGGSYYIGGGGTSRWLNNHTAYPAQDFALDIVKLNAFGNRALGIWPQDLSQYEIYSDSVFSPCKGKVSKTEDGHDDQIPPNRDTKHLAGNHLVITCQGVDILMAHLKKFSINVSPGDSVISGQFVGKVGNSGNTTQPHLHIHAEVGGNAVEILDGKGYPITFSGRFLVRNNLVW